MAESPRSTTEAPATGVAAPATAAPARAPTEAEAQANAAHQATLVAAGEAATAVTPEEEALEAHAATKATTMLAAVVEETSGEMGDKQAVHTAELARQAASNEVIGGIKSGFQTPEDLKLAVKENREKFKKIAFNDYKEVDPNLPSRFAATKAGKWQEWYNGHPEYSTAKQYVLEQFDMLNAELVNNLIEQLHRKEELTKDTRNQLGDLAQSVQKNFEGRAMTQDEALLMALNRYIQVLVASYKSQNELVGDKKYADEIDGSKSRAEIAVMDEIELSKVIESLRRLKALPFKELVHTITVNQDIITMLGAQEAFEGKKYLNDTVGLEALADGRRVQDGDAISPLHVFLQVREDTQHENPAKNDKSKIQNRLALESSQPHEGATTIVDRAVGEMANDAGFVRLAQLIAGNRPTLAQLRGEVKRDPSEDKSEAQRTIEMGELAPRILERLKPAQREYLAYVLNREYGRPVAEDYIMGAFAAGAMTVADLDLLAKRNPDLRWVKSPTVTKNVEVTIKEKVKRDRVRKLCADRMIHRYQESAFVENFSPRGICGAAMYVGGILTGVLNGTLIIADAIKGNHDFDTAAKNFLTSGYIWGGVAFAVAGNHMLAGPDFLNDFLSMDKEMREHISIRDKYALFHNTLLTYPKMNGYMQNHWESLKRQAWLNKRNDNPKAGKQRRGEYKLEPSDIDLDVVNLYEQTGLRSAKEAREMIAMLFNTMYGPIGQKESPPFGEDTPATQFASFVKQNVLKDMPAENEAFNYATTKENIAHGNIANAPLHEDSMEDVQPAIQVGMK